jgi:hypothetical protein
MRASEMSMLRDVDEVTGFLYARAQSRPESAGRRTGPSCLPDITG